jgi:acetyl-CoA carboxylase biotin carboxyl carrier protein
LFINNYGLKMTKTTKSSSAPEANSSEGTLIRNLAELINETNLNEIEYEKEGLRIKISRSSPPSPSMQTYFTPAPNMSVPPMATNTAAPVTQTTATSEIAETIEAVKSPMVGVLYLSPEPGSKPFVNVGDSVKEGQPICIIEAMKTFNSVTAPKSGVVKKIIAKDGSPIEFDEPIMVIE